MSYQDWTPVVIHNKQNVKEQYKQKQNLAGTKEFNKLNEDDVPKLDKITPEQSKFLCQARTEKKLSQLEFAKSLNINVSLIKEYENGTVKNFNKKFYNTLIRKLGIKI